MVWICIIYYQTVSCHRNCAVILWISGWKIENPCFQFKRLDPHVFHQGAIAVYYVPTPVQHSQMRCEWGALGYLANSWRAAARQITVMSWPSMCETKIQRMKPDGGNKFRKFESKRHRKHPRSLAKCRGLTSCNTPECSMASSFSKAIPWQGGNTEVWDCGTTLKRPTWFDGCIPKFVLSENKLVLRCFVLIHMNFHVQQFKQPPSAQINKPNKKTNEPANKQANKQTMRWNSGNYKPKSKPKLVCHIVMTSPIQVANGVPHDFQGGHSFYSSTMS